MFVWKPKYPIWKNRRSCSVDSKFRIKRRSECQPWGLVACWSNIEQYEIHLQLRVGLN